MKYQVSFSWLTCYFHIHIKRLALLSLHKKSHLVQWCLWQQCLCQSNFDATSKWQTIYLTWNYLNIIGCWHAYCSTRKLLSEESYQALTVYLARREKAIHWSRISEIETHIESKVKRTEKNKALTCEIFFQHSKRNFVSPPSHVICNMLYTLYGLYFFFGGGGGGNFCSFFPLHINSPNLRTHPAKWLPQHALIT